MEQRGAAKNRTRNIDLENYITLYASTLQKSIVPSYKDWAHMNPYKVECAHMNPFPATYLEALTKTLGVKQKIMIDM